MSAREGAAVEGRADLRALLEAATSGPWFVGERSLVVGGDWFPIIMPRLGAPICDLNRKRDRPGITVERNAADARLISLAPELAAVLLVTEAERERYRTALEQIADAPHVSGDRGCGKWKDIARQALTRPEDSPREGGGGNA